LRFQAVAHQVSQYAAPMRANILFDASSQAIHGLLAVVPPVRIRALQVQARIRPGTDALEQLLVSCASLDIAGVPTPDAA